ncbi:MAG TPA: DUF1553 domain-containing protein, partial [Armatimonadota bacterium]|nr:DUF1553 domain-containing protein [Armatimonadota bacterium]
MTPVRARLALGAPERDKTRQPLQNTVQLASDATKRDKTRHPQRGRASAALMSDPGKRLPGPLSPPGVGGPGRLPSKRASIATIHDKTRHPLPAARSPGPLRSHSTTAARVDPQNLLLWRQNPRRMDAEALRDSILAVSGTLNPQAGGPPVRVPLEPEVYDQIFSEGEPDNLWPVTPDVRQHARRSLYLLRKRNVRLPMLAVFDQPDMMSSCGARLQSVHALQALTLMNSDFMLEQSRALARRVLTESGGDPAPALDRLYRLALARSPRPAEVRRAKAFLQGQAEVIRKRIAAGEPVARLDGVR